MLAHPTWKSRIDLWKRGCLFDFLEDNINVLAIASKFKIPHIMVNWESPAEIARDAAVFERIIFVFLGIVLWELFMTREFEWSLLTRRRKFRWPLSKHRVGYMTFTLLPAAFFFFCRYCILTAFIGLIVSFTISTRIDCKALYTFISWAGNMTILCASTSLMLRTLALWERCLLVLIPLAAFGLAHWIVLYRTMFIVSASWNDTIGACVVTQTNPDLLRFTYFLTMAFDCVIMVLTATALLKKHTARTDLWKLLFHDGLVYFVVSFTMNCVPAVLNILNYNETMNVIATVPATAISSIASCRAVMRLLEFNTSDVYVHSRSAAGNGNQRTIAGFARPSKSTRPEVHVTTEHRTAADFSSLKQLDLESNARNEIR